jgi:FlgO protein
MFVELVASRLVQHGVGVVEVRLRDAIAVREGGPYALSDDARDLARRVQARAALSGSYAVTSEYALITARLIDVATGIVLSSWDKHIPSATPITLSSRWRRGGPAPIVASMPFAEICYRGCFRTQRALAGAVHPDHDERTIPCPRIDSRAVPRRR